MQGGFAGVNNSPQVSNLTAQEAWKLIDRVLLQAKTSEIAEEMHKKIAQAKAAAHGEGLRKRNGAYYPHQLIVLEEAAADEWARKLYDAGLEVCRIQGYEPFRPFQRAVYGHLLAPLFAARRSTVTAEMRRTEVRNGIVGQTQAHQGAFTRAMKRLHSRWNIRVEGATREFEHAAQREERSKAARQAVSDAPHSIPEQPRTPAKKGAFAAHITKSTDVPETGDIRRAGVEQ